MVESDGHEPWSEAEQLEALKAEAAVLGMVIRANDRPGSLFRYIVEKDGGDRIVPCADIDEVDQAVTPPKKLSMNGLFAYLQATTPAVPPAPEEASSGGATPDPEASGPKPTAGRPRIDVEIDREDCGPKAEHPAFDLGDFCLVLQRVCDDRRRGVRIVPVDGGARSASAGVPDREDLEEAMDDYEECRAYHGWPPLE